MYYEPDPILSVLLNTIMGSGPHSGFRIPQWGLDTSGYRIPR